MVRRCAWCGQVLPRALGRWLMTRCSRLMPLWCRSLYKDRSERWWIATRRPGELQAGEVLPGIGHDPRELSLLPDRPGRVVAARYRSDPGTVSSTVAVGRGARVGRRHRSLVDTMRRCWRIREYGGLACKDRRGLRSHVSRQRELVLQQVNGARAAVACSAGLIG